MEASDSLSKNALQAVIGCSGAAAIVLAVEQLGLTDNLAVRKSISNLLAGLGEEAVPPLLVMLGDRRWFIVRNVAAVLGTIASPEAVYGLTKCLQHADIRVCKEAVRSLANIGGREAEAALIGVLQQDKPALYPQVIASLGGMKSRKSLVELMKIVLAKDMFLKSLTLKTDALSAVAMIGDRQVTAILTEILVARHFIAAGRWKQLRAAVALCLGKLGDPRALPALKSLSSTSGILGSACCEAVDMIEKSGGYANGGA